MRQGRRRRDGQVTTRTATRRSTTRWCAWPRTSPSAIRWSTARATSATSTAITPPPCATPRRADRRPPRCCSRASTRTPSTSAHLRRRRTTSRSSCRPASPTCWPTARPASPSAWRPASRRTTPTSCATRCLHLIKHPNATIEKLVELRAGPGLPHRRRHRRAARADPGGLQDRPRRLPPARPWEKEDTGPRHLPDRRHRDPLPGAEGQAGRAHRRADRREEGCRCWATCATSCAEDVRLVLEPKSRTVDPVRADGEPVQADRARDPLLRST